LLNNHSSMCLRRYPEDDELSHYTGAELTVIAED
jgi:hypothetical protein